MRDKDTDLIWESYDNKSTPEDHNAAEAKDKSRGEPEDELEQQAAAEAEDERLSSENHLNEQAQELNLDVVVHLGAEHFNKYRGKGDHDDIMRELESHFIGWFKSNTGHYTNTDQVINYIEDGGFRQDLSDLLDLDLGGEEMDILDDISAGSTADSPTPSVEEMIDFYKNDPGGRRAWISGVEWEYEDLAKGETLEGISDRYTGWSPEMFQQVLDALN